ncbi:MAG: HEAT repeat domain-containing protein, partial [Cytophagales bacterium]|nr:HEAT repeat domain-containing protein [Cytophagales bacterium]
MEGIVQLLSLLEEKPKEVVGVQHLLLQLRCVNEWLCVAGEDLEAGLAELEGKFQVMRSLKKWFGRGLERVRSRDDRQLLSLLTTGLQGLRAVAGHAPMLLELLLEALRDDNWQVRRAARSALGELVKAAPAAQVLPRLLEAMRDDNDPYGEVRIAALSALGELLKAAPQNAAQVLPGLLEAMRDDNWQVRSATSSALGKISLQQLIESYWATQKQALIPLIAPQLYHTPLLVRTSQQHQQRLVLHPTAGQSVTWDKPQQEVQPFVQQIKNAAKLREWSFWPLKR